MTADRELLELCAKAFWVEEFEDVSIRWSEAEDGILYIHAENQDHNGLDREFVWAPHRDQADSDRMAFKLRMSTRISINDVFCMVELPRLITAYVAHNNTDEDVCRAGREARMAVAVEIGRAMP
jgi:hypothetical protein